MIIVALTTTRRLPEELEAHRSARLDAQGVGLSNFIRETEKLERDPAQRPAADDLGKNVFGNYRGRRDDLSIGRGLILDELLRPKPHR